MGTDTFAVSTSTYNFNLPVVIQIDYGNTVAAAPSSQGNLEHCTFYGGSLDEGNRLVKVNKSGEHLGFYTTIGMTRSWDATRAFPTAPGTQISSSVTPSGTSNYLTAVLFDSLGARLSANIYGEPNNDFMPIGAIINGRRITIVGNTYAATSAFPTFTPNLTAGSYTNNAGPGFILQFEYNQFNNSMNTLKWRTRTNGIACDISFKPNSKDIYLASASDLTYTYDPLITTAGSQQSFGQSSGWHYEFSRYDSVGVRKWNCAFPIYSSAPADIGSSFNYNLFENASFNVSNEKWLKCKIDCDNYGCNVGGEFNTALTAHTTYAVPTITPGVTFANGLNDAFALRINSKDTSVYVTLIGGTSNDAFTNSKCTGANEATFIGYSASSQYKNLTYLAPSSIAYIDSTAPSSSCKMLINRFDTIGNRTWGTYFGGGSAKAVAWGITQDNANKMYISGLSTSGGLSFPVSNPTGLYSKTGYLGGSSDGTILGFNDQGQMLWNTYLGGDWDESILSLDWNSVNNRLMLAGVANTPAKNSTGVTDFFPATTNLSGYPTAWFRDAINASNSYTTAYTGPHDGFVGWFTVANVIGIQEYFKDGENIDAFHLYPNPTNGEAFIAFKNGFEGKITIEVYNQIGQLVFNEFKPNVSPYSIFTLNTSRFALTQPLERLSHKPTHFFG